MQSISHAKTLCITNLQQMPLESFSSLKENVIIELQK
jgi:hypothetical protein